MKNELIVTGKVDSLCLDGVVASSVHFNLEGPVGDRHASIDRKLSGHDNIYTKTSDLNKGDMVFNWRQWTAISTDELTEIEKDLGKTVPVGCLLENLRLSGIPNFSKLLPTSRLVFPKRDGSQAILAVWEENTPCAIVAKRLAEHYGEKSLATDLIKYGLGKRGSMGLVLSSGVVEVGDEVNVYPPVA